MAPQFSHTAPLLAKQACLLTRSICHLSCLVMMFFYSSLSAQPDTDLLLPSNIHLPKDVRAQSIYDKSGEKIMVKYQYYYDHWSEQAIKHGLYTRWDKHGTTRQEMEFADGRLIHRISRNAKGEMMRESNWNKRLRHGIQRRFYSQSRLKHEIQYVEGKKEGLEKSYFPSGSIKWVRIFHKGKAQGPKVRYRKDGSLRQKFKDPKPQPLSPKVEVETEVESEHSQVSSKS